MDFSQLFLHYYYSESGDESEEEENEESPKKVKRQKNSANKDKSKKDGKEKVDIQYIKTYILMPSKASGHHLGTQTSKNLERNLLKCQFQP